MKNLKAQNDYQPPKLTNSSQVCNSAPKKSTTQIQTMKSQPSMVDPCTRLNTALPKDKQTNKQNE